MENMDSNFTVGFKQGQEHGKQIILEKVKDAFEDIRKERDKCYEDEYTIGHGWGMQSAIEILERHLGEELNEQ